MYFGGQTAVTRRVVGMLLALVLCFSCVLPLTTKAYAAMADEAVHYELGETYSGSISNNLVQVPKYYVFNVSQKSHVSIRVNSNATYSKASCEFNIISSSGKTVLSNNDINWSYNSAKGTYSGRQYRVLSKGTYYLKINSGYNGSKYSFYIDAESQIKLAKGVLSSLKSAKKGQMTVKAAKAKNAIGYRIQYSLYSNFKSCKTIKTPSLTKTITGLKKGKYYYVRVAPYTVYSDGTVVYGQNSLPKHVYVKK